MNHLRLMFLLATVIFCGSSTLLRAQPDFKGERRAPNPTVYHRTRSTPSVNTRVEQALAQGNNWRDEGEFEKAEVFYKRALALNPKESRAYVGLGNIEQDSAVDYIKDSDMDAANKRAEVYYQRALALNPKEAGAYLGLGWLHYADEAAYAPSEKNFREALKLNPKSSEAYRGLGMLYENQQRYADAIAAYREQSRLEPEETFIHYQLGELYLKLKNKSAAMEEYQILLRMEARKKPDALSGSRANRLLGEINKQ